VDPDQRGGEVNRLEEAEVAPNLYINGLPGIPIGVHILVIEYSQSFSARDGLNSDFILHSPGP